MPLLRIEGKFLSSKIARKIFFIFIAAAFVPLLAMSAISYYQVSQLIEQETFQSLQSTSKETGLNIYESLMTSKEKILLLAEFIPQTDSAITPYPDVSSPIFTPFKNINTIENAKVTSILFGQKIDVATTQYTVPNPYHPWSLQIDHLAGEAAIYLLMSLAGNKHIIAELKNDYLWQESLLSADKRICLFTHTIEVLFCNGSFDVQMLSQVINRPRITTERDFSWTSGSRVFLASYWDLFLQHEFGSESWIIVASQPEHIAFANLRFFRNSFIPVIVGSLLLISLLSVVFIRRNLSSIDSLIKGTRKVSNNEFDSVIEVRGKDEFSELADAFNSMIATLSYQFRKLRFFAEFDHHILENRHLDDIATFIFRGLEESIVYHCAHLVITDPQLVEHTAIYSQHYRSGGRCKKQDQQVDASLLAKLTSENYCLLEASELYSSALQPVISPVSACYLVFSLKRQTTLQAVVLLGLEQAVDLGEALISQISEISNRSEVALAALARERQLERQAYFDTLTQVANRNQIQQHTQKAVKEAQMGGHQGAFLFLDLDRFKNVNDAYGHTHGDLLLTEAAKRLSSALIPGQFLARFGGDEFTVLLPVVRSVDEVKKLAEKLIITVSEPFTISTNVVYISASIGISLFPDHSIRFDDILRCADIAMYQAKAAGKECFRIYEPAMTAISQQRMELERDLRKAVHLGQLELFYQPKLNLANQRVTGFEALLRWNHPVFGFVAPDKTIPIAEESGLILSLGEYVLNTAMKQWSDWCEAGLHPGIMAINVSAKQLMDTNFREVLKSAISSNNVPPENIELEVTESLLLEQPDKAADILTSIHSMGIRLAIDDFGTGYSSLSYLTKLPLDVLKIDRSFVCQLDQNSRAEGVIANIIDLSHHLGLSVVAEGVETVKHLNILKLLGCDEIQGYLISKPQPPEQVSKYLRKPILSVENL